MPKKKPERSEPSAAERSLHGQIAVHARWAKCEDRSAATAAARRAMANRFEREVDPDGVLPPEELGRRVASARKAYFARLSLMAAQARRAKRDGQQK
jgi:hypothetical protein